MDHPLFLELTDPHSVKLEILILGRDARLQGCTSDFVSDCRQNEGDTRASESTNVGTDEYLNDGSNNGATTLESPGIIAVQSSRRKAWALPAQSTDHVVKVKVVDVHVFEFVRLATSDYWRQLYWK